jgi:hypothetical protein
MPFRINGLMIILCRFFSFLPMFLRSYKGKFLHSFIGWNLTQFLHYPVTSNLVLVVSPDLVPDSLKAFQFYLT